MGRFVILALVILASVAGCGESNPVDIRAQAIERPDGTIALRQVTITDESGSRTVTVPNNGPVSAVPMASVVSAPPSSLAITRDDVMKEEKEAAEEMNKVWKQVGNSGDSQRLEWYQSLVRRLIAVDGRLMTPECDLARELAEIQAIRAALKKAL